jgi:hypothetical protein
MTKVEIPYLAKLAENKTIRLNQAYLIVEPVEEQNRKYHYFRLSS